MISIDATFRPVHYLGNKSRFLAPITDAMLSADRAGSTVVDLFAGTGVVSRSLAQTHPVISGDIQKYSGTLTQALCNPTKYSEDDRLRIAEAARDWLGQVVPLAADLLAYEEEASSTSISDPYRFARLVEEGSLVQAAAHDPLLVAAKSASTMALRAAGATLTTHYGGVYFSYHQALQLDALMFAIGQGEGRESDPTLVSAVMGAASDCVATVGNHFAQPLRLRDKSGLPKTRAITQAIRTRSTSVLASFDGWLARYSALDPAPFPCAIEYGDFRDLLSRLPERVGAIYADPPYTRDHYSRFYHVLETIALGDLPGVSNAPGSNLPSRGLYRRDRHQSPFSIRTQVAGAFDSLFSLARKQSSSVVLSYSPQGGGTRMRPETRLMTIDQILRIAESHYRYVEVRSIAESVHSRFNQNHLNGLTPTDAEILIVARV